MKKKSSHFQTGRIDIIFLPQDNICRESNFLQRRNHPARFSGIAVLRTEVKNNLGINNFVIK